MLFSKHIWDLHIYYKNPSKLSEDDQQWQSFSTTSVSHGRNSHSPFKYIIPFGGAGGVEQSQSAHKKDIMQESNCCIWP